MAKYIDLMYGGKPFRLYFEEYQRLMRFRSYQQGKQDTAEYIKKIGHVQVKTLD